MLVLSLDTANQHFKYSDGWTPGQLHGVLARTRSRRLEDSIYMEIIETKTS